MTLGKLGPEDVTPLVGALRSGQTLRGVFDVGAVGDAAADLNVGAVSYQFPIGGNAPAVTVLKKGEIDANCAGVGSGQAPTAAAGNLCIYLTEEVNLDETAAAVVVEDNTPAGIRPGRQSESRRRSSPPMASGR